MIKNLLTNIYIASRLFVSVGAIASAFVMPSLSIRAIIITLTFIYFSFALLSYYKLKLGHYINKYLDLFYFGGYFYFSNPYFYPLSLVSISLLSPRQVKTSYFISALFIAFSIYKAYNDIPLLIFLISLQMGVLVASMCPDIISALKKERHQISNLRIAYKDMLKHMGDWELNQRQHQNYVFLLEKALISKDINEFLEFIKQKFDANISIYKLDNVLQKDVVKDYKNGVLSIILPKGDFSLFCKIEFANPIDLYNENLIYTLEYACGVCSLYYMVSTKEQALLWKRQEVA